MASIFDTISGFLDLQLILTDPKEGLAWMLGCLIWMIGVGLSDGLRYAGARNTVASGAVAVARRVAANLLLFLVMWLPIVLVLDAWLQPVTHGNNALYVRLTFSRSR